MSTTDGMTYEEWLAEQKAKSEAKVEADYTSAKNDINTTYDETVKKVESDHQRTLTDIDTSYQKNLAGYGRNAELLASMGLTNSGYSDYLNSQAFAQKSSTTRSANRDRATLLEGADKSRKSALETAAATRENALNSIDTTYQSAIFDYRSDKFNKLYTNALNGMYAGLEEEALNKLITENHLTSDQAEELKSAISFYNTQKADTDKKTAFDNISALASSGHFYGKTDDEIRTQIASYGFGKEQVDIILRANALYTEDKNEKNVLKDEKTKQEAYNSILALAQSGHYADMSDDEIKTALEKYEFLGYSVEAILEANKDYKDGKARNDLEINNRIYTAFVENIYNGIYSSVQDVQSALKLQGVGEDSDLWKSVVSAYQTENYNTILYSIEQGYTYTESQLEELVTSGEITEEQKQRIINALRNGETELTVQPENNNDGEIYVSGDTNATFKASDTRGNGSGSFNGVNYSISGLNARIWSLATDTFDLNVGGQTYTLVKGIYVDSKKLDELYPKAPRGTIVVLNGKIYIANGDGLWCASTIEGEAYQKIVAAFNKNTAATPDTSYGANVGTGTGDTPVWAEPGEDYYSANGINPENSLMNNTNFGTADTADVTPSGSVKHEWGDSGTANYDKSTKTTTGSVYGKEYKVTTNGENLTISIGGKTRTISTMDLYRNGVDGAFLSKTYGNTPGRIVIVDEKCYISYQGSTGFSWVRVDDKIAKEMINEFKGIDTSYGANVGTGTGGSVGGSAGRSPSSKFLTQQTLK